MKDAKFSNDLATNSWLNLQVDQLQMRKGDKGSLGERRRGERELKRVTIMKDAQFSNDLAANSWLNLQVD